MEYFRATAAAPRGYRFFIHVVDPDSGQQLGNLDHEVQQGAAPLGTWPAGQVVEDAHAFTMPNYQLDWDNRSPSLTPYQLAISMTTSDLALVNALRRQLGTRSPYFWVGNRLTFILIDQDGNY